MGSYPMQFSPFSFVLPEASMMCNKTWAVRKSSKNYSTETDFNDGHGKYLVAQSQASGGSWNQSGHIQQLDWNVSLSILTSTISRFAFVANSVFLTGTVRQIIGNAGVWLNGCEGIVSYLFDNEKREKNQLLWHFHL